MSKLVYVIMGNDFPSGVFSDKEIAEAWCKKKNAHEKKLQEENTMHRSIYWRSYEFTLDAEVGK